MNLANPIVLISGPSCSGKSSIAAAVQELMDEPYLHVGIDHFEAMQPERHGRRISVFYGQRGDRTWDADHDLVHVHHICLAAFAEAGAHVVAEHIFLKRRWLRDAVRRLEKAPVLLVGVQCSVEDLERRERAREGKNPSSGQAVRQRDLLAPLDQLSPYDLVLDTTRLSPQACAERIKARLREGPPPTGFESLRGSPFLDGPDSPLA
jgi:chloramphenicol 3-O phosphotransferase